MESDCWPHARDSSRRNVPLCCTKRSAPQEAAKNSRSGKKDVPQGLKSLRENSKKRPSGAKGRRIFNPLRPD
jgi:hypothetical protein